MSDFLPCRAAVRCDTARVMLMPVLFWAVSTTCAALPLAIRPIAFGNGMIATGTLFTDDTTQTVTDWHLQVTTTTLLGRYTPANTVKSAVSDVFVSSDGLHLGVRTSPDSASGADGGALSFRAPNPFADVGVTLADFSAGASPGGEAFYMYGPAFDTQLLNQPDGAEFRLATRGSVSTHYVLDGVIFGGGVTVAGSIDTDGTTGVLAPGNLVDWNITATEVVTDVFDRSNSVLSGTGVAVSPDGAHVNVANPDGMLEFTKGAVGGHKYALTLADFTGATAPRGIAGYFVGRQAVYTVALPAAGAWEVTGTTPIGAVPEPGALALVLAGCGVVGAVVTRRGVARGA